MTFLQQIKDLAFSGNTKNEIIYKQEKDDLTLLHKIIVAPHVSLAFMVLHNSGFFDKLIPEIKESLVLKSRKRFKEIWPHTLEVLSQTPPRLNLRWSALFHDLGKVKAFSTKNGKVTFHHHEHISARIFLEFSKRAKIFTSGQKNCIHFLVNNLGYVEGYKSEWSDNAVRRFDREMGMYVDDLLVLSTADITTKNKNRKENILKKIQELKDRIDYLRIQYSQRIVLPKGIGNSIREKFGVQNQEIGIIKSFLEKQVDNGVILNNKDIEYYIDYLSAYGVQWQHKTLPRSWSRFESE